MSVDTRTHLAHEPLDDAVEGAPLERKRLAHLAHALLACSRMARVWGGGVGVQWVQGCGHGMLG